MNLVFAYTIIPLLYKKVQHLLVIIDSRIQGRREGIKVLAQESKLLVNLDVEFIEDFIKHEK